MRAYHGRALDQESPVLEKTIMAIQLLAAVAAMLVFSAAVAGWWLGY